MHSGKRNLGTNYNFESTLIDIIPRVRRTYRFVRHSHCVLIVIINPFTFSRSHCVYTQFIFIFRVLQLRFSDEIKTYIICKTPLDTSVLYINMIFVFYVSFYIVLYPHARCSLTYFIFFRIPRYLLRQTLISFQFISKQCKRPCNKLASLRFTTIILLHYYIKSN